MVTLIDSELREKRVYAYDVAQNRYEENQRKKGWIPKNWQ